MAEAISGMRSSVLQVLLQRAKIQRQRSGAGPFGIVKAEPSGTGLVVPKGLSLGAIRDWLLLAGQRRQIGDRDKRLKGTASALPKKTMEVAAWRAW